MCSIETHFLSYKPLDLIRMTIESEGVAGRGFASVNLESKSAGIKTEDQLYDYVRGHLSDKGRTYVFIDEPQRIEGWQDAVNAMRVDFQLRRRMGARSTCRRPMRCSQARPGSERLPL